MQPNMTRTASVSALGLLALALALCDCGAAMNNYSSGPCQDNCGGDASCVASCQEINGPGPRPTPPPLGVSK